MTIRKRILRWASIVCGALILVFIIYFIWVAIDHPPEIKELSILETEREKVGENIYVVGNNWLRKSECGLWEMYVEGDPFVRGVAFGKLTEELMFYQETAFFERIGELIPSPGYLRFLKYFIAWFNRNLDKNIQDEYKAEIYGTSFYCSSEFNFIGSAYQRQLNYHAAHDIGHMVQDMQMGGCTSFSCWNDKSADSTLLVGRNFDFFAGRKFAENKIVCFYKPSSGYKFMMVSWAGMIGVVSGMNEKGLTVTINASKSTIPHQASTPVTLLAREILQYAANLDQAYAIAKKRKIFVSESILVGSVEDGEAAIIEKSPLEEDIVYAENNQIVCSNHFQGNIFKNDKTNIGNIQGSDSQYRFKRVNELLQQEKPIDVADAVAILRNQQGLGNVNLGMGNQLAINQLIAHHAVIFKPSQQLVWVSTSPYQLGKFVAYDLNKIFSLDKKAIMQNQEIYSSELTIATDTFLYSENFNNYKRYLEMTEELKKYSREQNPLPVSFEKNYIPTNPQLYLTYVHLGKYFYEMKQYQTAYNYYQKALSKEVAGMNERSHLMELSSKTLKKLNNADS